MSSQGDIILVGDHPLALDDHGRLKCPIGTFFPDTRVLVTLPGIHATQRRDHVLWLNQQRRERGQAELTEEEERHYWYHSVDLVMERNTILIRPDPDDMDLAFQADEMLQSLVPKHRIKFLYVLQPQVHEAIKWRGECWRIASLPKTPAEMAEMIAASRTAPPGEPCYYYNKASGTRLLTYEQFSRLAWLSPAALRQRLIEIKTLAYGVNRHDNPELSFFMVDDTFSKKNVARHPWSELDDDALRQAYQALREEFQQAVPPAWQHDDPLDPAWRNQMCARLIGRPDDQVTEETLLGLACEFLMQIQWLPGGRIEQGELIFDPLLRETHEDIHDPEHQQLYDEKAREFIYNIFRSHDDLEYVNIGRVMQSLSTRPGAAAAGRRDVYVAEIKLASEPKPIVRMLRMQKWGVREHLDEGMSLERAMIESDEYREYTLDRRMGCRRLGMRVGCRSTAGQIQEVYRGPRAELYGQRIWSTYFQRDYIRGIATDKIPQHKIKDPAYALRLAHWLGDAAAPNLIVGRWCELSNRVLFDDGDEILIEDAQGLPERIVVSDHTGTFRDYQQGLACHAVAYAQPVLRRAKHLADVEAFTQAYLDAFVTRFQAIQQEYRDRPGAFDLFRHRRWDTGGSFAYRWDRVLARMDQTDPVEVAERIRAEVEHGLAKLASQLAVA